MKHRIKQINRRAVMGGFATAGAMIALPASLRAQSLGDLIGETSINLSSILGRASDNALDRLAEPGAYYNDPSVRIGLPFVGNIGGGRGGLLGSIMDAGNELGVLDDVTRSVNDAAGVAAGEAKPIFRDAIDDLSFNDVPSIIDKKDGGTQYLRTSSNDRLHSRLQPLIDGALEDAGVYGTFDSLADQHSFIRQAGLSREKINASVTDQGLDGIFSYIAKEEGKFRANPIGGLLGN